MYSKKTLKRIYRASFNAKIAKTISLAHLGPKAQSVFRETLPDAFHSDQPFIVKDFLSKCSTADHLSINPCIRALRSHWRDRAAVQGIDLSACKTHEDIAAALGIAPLKILSTPGCMDATKERHFQNWLKVLYRDLFPVKSRAKKLSEKLYAIKHEFLAENTPVCLHRLPSGEIREYYEVDGWGFHGELVEPDGCLPIQDIPDFEHLNLRPVSEAYTKDPWEDVLSLLNWERKDRLGEAFFLAAHDDFQDWLIEQNKAS